MYDGSYYSSDVREALLEYYTNELNEAFEKYPEIRDSGGELLESLYYFEKPLEISHLDIELGSRPLYPVPLHLVARKLKIYKSLKDPEKRKALIGEFLEDSFFGNTNYECQEFNVETSCRTLNVAGKEDIAKVFEETKDCVLKKTKLMDDLIEETAEMVESKYGYGKHDPEIIEKEFSEVVKGRFSNSEDLKNYLKESREMEIEAYKKRYNALKKSVKFWSEGKLLEDFVNTMEKYKPFHDLAMDVIISEIYGENNG